VPTKETYRLANSDGFSKAYGLRDQIHRSSVSIMSNVQEGFDRRSNKELVNFLKYAETSTCGVRSQLFVALDVGPINKITQNELDEQL
jgi:four helix bundle protein